MPRKKLSVQEALAIFEELPLDEDSTASNNSDEGYVENVAQGENISSDEEEINEVQIHENTFQSKHKVVYTWDVLFAVPEKTFIPLDSCVGPATTVPSSKLSYLL
ncbi:hypothetical protein TNIN_490581 [Trichonephila inaurata madagascariensis]|uniref:Uncharacterized protein n=1 Tax=Trichonephila inaurata madagascariensis TaxID=2747483 RepID=A0A8X6WZS0_9ARAC|nr:hypothetical protein TNIN_490581 [Trichonephila inaurata madagascariensis]